MEYVLGRLFRVRACMLPTNYSYTHAAKRKTPASASALGPADAVPHNYTNKTAR